MTALSDAARAVEEAAEAVLWDSNRSSIAHLIAAVRHHDAETARDFAGQLRAATYGKATAYVQGIRDTADRIDSKEQP